MKVLLLTHEFFPQLGGVANVITNLYHHFQSTDEELIVLNPFTEGKNLFKKILKKQYNFRDFPNIFRKRRNLYLSALSFWKILCDKNIPFSNRILLILYFFTKPKIFQLVIENVNHLYPFLKKLDFDLIISGHSGWILPLSFLLSRYFNKKLVTIAYGLDFLVINPLSLKTYFFRNCDKVIVITKETKNLIQKIHHIDSDKLKVIYVGINQADLEVKESKMELRKKYNISSKDFIILSVGRHVPRKNFQLVINALYDLKKKDAKLKLKYYLIGEGEDTENLQNLTHKLGLDDDVKFLGSCDIKTRNEFYKLSDLFIMPSITKKNDIEGFGIVFLEANYFRVPTIGARSGGVKEAIIDGETGYLISPNDINELIEKILFLYNNPDIRDTLGLNGYKRVIKNFNWNTIINEYRKVLKQLVD